VILARDSKPETNLEDELALGREGDLTRVRSEVPTGLSDPLIRATARENGGPYSYDTIPVRRASSYAFRRVEPPSYSTSLFHCGNAIPSLGSLSVSRYSRDVRSTNIGEHIVSGKHRSNRIIAILPLPLPFTISLQEQSRSQPGVGATVTRLAVS